MTSLIIDMLMESLSGHKLQLIIYHNEDDSLYNLNMGIVEYVKEIHNVPWGRHGGGYRKTLPEILSYLKNAEVNGLVFPFDLDSLEEEIKKHKLTLELDKFVVGEE